jgi:putative membrane protein
MGDGFGMGWGIVMMVAMLLLVAVVIVGIVWLVLRLVRDRGSRGRADGAPSRGLEVLERRFAAGEIDADEYRDRRATLERGG